MAEAEEVKIAELVQAETFDYLVGLADGDGRKFFNYFENVISLFKINTEIFPLSIEKLQEVVGTRVLSYDKSSDQHYDCISAFIKSVRGSDADAALYYMARMLAGGEDPVYIARRLVILASEDIGNAEPRALPLAIAGLQATELIGLPECAINLSQVVTFLSSCPKSNRSYMAWNKAKEFVEQTGSPELPEGLKSGSKSSGEYVYPQDFEKGWVEQNYWPPKLKTQHFYEPSKRGHEKIISEYLLWLKGK